MVLGIEPTVVGATEAGEGATIDHLVSPRSSDCFVESKMATRRT
jgi:hypothetical protein